MKKTVPLIAAACVVLAWAYFYVGGGDAPAPPSGGGAGAALADVRLPAEFSPNAQIGARAFAAKCAACHGENADGIDGSGPPLVHKIYEPSHHGDMAFLLAARNGVISHHWSFGNMMPVDGISDAEVGYIVTYIRELQKENGIF